MLISKIINDVFRQDFSNKAVLGRVLFGLGIFILGLLHLVKFSQFVSQVPQYLPLAPLFVVVIGGLFLIIGFLIIANMHLRFATQSLIVIYGLFVVVVYLPSQDWVALLLNLSLMGASLMIYAAVQAKKDAESAEAEKK